MPESYEVRISKGYIVNIHSCIERFLLAFKDLPGSPTKKKEYKPEKDKNRLQWTLKHCYGSIDGDIGELYNVCNYYRLVRNGKEGFKAVHEYLVNGGKSCMAGFVLKNTLSDNGGVTRGICKMDTENNLTEVVETGNIIKTENGAEADIRDGK